ncbi:MAG: vitamin B12-dependent ribonucleotide reductase [Planctomycetes bacterium]|nr:vitamin B12-dependent ribonucleotide reductase [Planctomycetota bacterium]MBI3835517.1 vitamin B12-dependent ribonucleotide reductase [Planctomycetota bacterium]
MAELGIRRGGLSVTDDTRMSKVGFSENAERVLRARYLKKDEQGKYTESIPELFRRVAKAVAEAETLYDSNPQIRSEWEERFYELMMSRRFMPNSPTLMNAGREMGMLSACFVLPVRDSINDIFDSIKHTALIQKAGGGTGFAFDELRPTGDYISSSGGTTSGPISFWRAFSEATNAIQQGAFRRGANMGMMYIHHPDILKFLHAKEDLTQFTNYNISVKVTDAWMDSFLQQPDLPHVVRNPRTCRTYLMPKNLSIWEYNIRSLTEIKENEPLPAGEFYSKRDMWNIILKNAHRTGEPGVVFIDRINEFNPTPHVGRIEATNPCGEQPLLPYEACNLGSINLVEFVDVNDRGAAAVDWKGLRSAVHESTRFLDNIIDVNRYPLQEITDMCKANRKIGLGIMGFADALYKLGVPYNSEEGVAWGQRFMKFVDEESHNYSEQLADERGNFPNWKGSIYDTKFNRPMRNATCTTVAPTGTISIISGCSGGIEPMYSLAFFRNVLRGQDEGKAPMVEINPIFEAVARRSEFYSEGLMERIATEGTLAHLENVPDELKRVFVCAHDISPDWHMRMQAAFQKHCDSSISKTINFPESATVEDVERIYRLAYELHCKGVTVYRNGCRKHQPMALKTSDTEHAKATEIGDTAVISELPTRIRLRPAVLPELATGVRVRQLTPFGNMHINITVDPKAEQELEVFAQLGKGGDLANSDLEAICRMVSLWLRSGGSLEDVISQLHGIGSSLQVSTKDGKIMSLGDGLARALRRYMLAKQEKGLRALLLGDTSVDAAAKKTVGTNGNGNGNGHHSTDADESGGSAAVPAPNKLDAHGIQWQQTQFKVRCPDCQGELRFGEGCMTCAACGFSKC